MRLISEKDLADMTGRSLKSLQTDRQMGRGIPFIKLGKLVRYNLKDVMDYIDAHNYTSTSQIKASKKVRT